MSNERTERPRVIGTDKTGAENEPTTPKESKVEQYISAEESLFNTVEDLGEEELQHGAVTQREDGSLVFDEAATVSREIATIDEFIAALENNQSVGRILGKEKPAFLQMLAELLKRRKEALENGDDVTIDDLLNSSSDSLMLSNMRLGDMSSELKNKLKTAAEMFKTHAQKEMIREVVAQQIPFIPFTSIRLNTDEEVSFDKRNLFDENAPIGDYGKLDWMYTVALDGQKELIISSQYGIDSVFVGDYEDQQAFVEGGKLGIGVEPSDSVVKKTDDLVINVNQGGSPSRPLFTRIRIIRKSLSLDKELHDYLEEEEEKQRKASRPGGGYSSSAPAASGSSSSYQAPPRQRIVSSS